MDKKQENKYQGRKYEYPSFVKKDFKLFNPIELYKKTEKIVCKDSNRKYTKFYCTGVYGGISTGYTVGCCLRCVFCWVDLSRDFPYKYGKFYSPNQVYERLLQNAKIKKVKKFRISGGEPTICKEHLLELLNLAAKEDYLFILESNGIVLGDDEKYIKELGKYPKDRLHIRISLKAGTKDGFQKRTGAIGDYYILPYKTIQNLLKSDISFHVASMSDPRLMPADERREMLNKLKEIGYFRYLEEEICDPYSTTIIRMKSAGFNIWK